MRTGPFSDSRVIDRLNAYFVPVLAVNEDYKGGGPAPKEERAEYGRIYREALAAKFSTGTVHVYIVEPGGKPIGTLHVATASRTPKLLALLDEVVAKLKLEPGKALVPPAPLSGCPAVPEGGLALHLTARRERGGGSWGGVSENWIVYDSDEVKKLLPAGEVSAGLTWSPDPGPAARLLNHFYPVTENNNVKKNRIEEQRLSGRVLSVEKGLARARLDGRLRMKHSFYHREDGNTVVASFTGYVDFDPATGRVKALRLATTEAAYGGGTFAVAVRSAR
jgi:hypothetical protein